MRQILFEWHGIRVDSYRAMLYLGLVVGILAGNLAAHAAGLDAARVFVAMVLLTIPGLVGARLLFVATHWAIYRREPRRIWRRSEGGGAMYGGLPLALLASLPVLDVLKLPLADFWDVTTFSILVGMIFTRLGCLLHGCCAGRPTQKWPALYLPDTRGHWRRRIPTQVLEAAWAALLLGGASAIYNRLPFPGCLFLCAIAGYGIGRLVLESTRERQEVPGSGLALQQAISLALVVLSAGPALGLWLLGRL